MKMIISLTDLLIFTIVASRGNLNYSYSKCIYKNYLNCTFKMYIDLLNITLGCYRIFAAVVNQSIDLFSQESMTVIR